MNRVFTHKIILCVVSMIVACGNAFSQADTSTSNTYDALSLKDLLNVKIGSVSKMAELLFDAPLSASVKSAKSAVWIFAKEDRQRRARANPPLYFFFPLISSIPYFLISSALYFRHDPPRRFHSFAGPRHSFPRHAPISAI